MKWGYSFYIKKWVFTGSGLCLTGLARFFFYFYYFSAPHRNKLYTGTLSYG